MTFWLTRSSTAFSFGMLLLLLAAGLSLIFGLMRILPELALFTIFTPMALILAVRPTGLFGR